MNFYTSKNVIVYYNSIQSLHNTVFWSLRNKIMQLLKRLKFCESLSQFKEFVKKKIYEFCHSKTALWEVGWQKIV